MDLPGQEHRLLTGPPPSAKAPALRAPAAVGFGVGVLSFGRRSPVPGHTGRSVASTGTGGAGNTPVGGALVGEGVGGPHNGTAGGETAPGQW